MSECIDVYVIDNAYTRIVHHFREAHRQMNWGGKRMRCESDGWREKQDIAAQQRGEELTRDDRKWKEIITNSIPDIKEEDEQESAKEKE